MADTLPNIRVPSNDWVDLYALSGITVGSRIFVMNIGVATVRLATQLTKPATDHDSYQEIISGTNTGMVNDTGDSGAWAFCLNEEALINVRAFP